MKLQKFSALAAAGLLAAGLAGCASNEKQDTNESGGAAGAQSAATGTVEGTFAGAGATAQEAAQAAWISEFQTSNPGVTINYAPEGSGAGREKFIQGATVFAGSDSYLHDDELAGSFARCAADTKAIDLPVYISPIAVVFNVEGVDALNLDSDVIAKIFRGEITKWNDKAIADLNKDAALPDLNITVVHRSDDSGTTENFTDYLHATAGEVWKDEASDKFPGGFAGAEGAQGTSGVIDAVKNGVGTIGYADASKTGDMAKAALKVGDKFVELTPAAAAAVVDASPRVDGRAENDLAIALDRTTTEDGAYPLVLVSYLIVCEQYADAEDAEFVREYATYIASPEGQAASESGAGSAPISDQTRDLINASIATIK